MIYLDNGNMVVVSSHRIVQMSDDFIKMQNLKAYGIFINNICPVCPSHAAAVMKYSTSSCICNIFQEPPYLNTYANLHRFSKAFSGRDTHEDSKEENTANIEAMLSESGILPVSELKSDQPTGLANSASAVDFLLNPLDLYSTICRRGKTANVVVDRSVSVYIDPAPTCIGKSNNALAYVAKVTDTFAASTTYVLLAVEEFDSSFYLNNVLSFKELGKYLVQGMKAIDFLYDKYFTSFFVIPESNSIDLGDFYTEASRLYAEEKLYPLQVYVSTINIENKKSKTAVAEENCSNFRVGYCLGSRKTEYVLNFFTQIFNSNIKKKTLCFLRFSSQLYSHSLANSSSIPCHVIDKLSQLTAKNRKKGVVISGKRRHMLSSGVVEFATDDLAISVIMATMMHDDLKNECTKFVTLQGQLCQF